MPALMRYAFVVVLLAIGCGKEIGDECVVDSDCSSSGDRTCDSTTQPGGYCTIRGCDFDTCPDEAVCVRFFTGSFTNRPCDPSIPREDNPCTLDEVCSLVGSCVPRSSELRFCMRKCDNDGDCRDGYECRTIEDMIAHGGEPVLGPGILVNESTAPKFCATAPR